VRRVIGAIGRVFITVGVLILLFVAYQLWGTGLYTAREQDSLESQFNKALAVQHREFGSTTTTQPSSTSSTAPGSTTSPTPGSTPASTTTTTTVPAPPPPPEGEAVARIRIPRIGVDSIVVNGTTRDDLRKGPGHYPETPLPGQQGNAAIAGHRTTYGAPFGDLDQLSPGDLIQVRTLQGSFKYRVTEQLVVNPRDVSVLDPVPVNPSRPDKGNKAMLTLTTCNPKYSAAQRLVIHADLDRGQVALPATTTKHGKITEEGLSGEESSKLPAIIAGLIAALIGALWWLAFHRHPRWVTWIVGAILFAIALFVFYVFLERVLPSNY
jgi:sortase A